MHQYCNLFLYLVLRTNTAIYFVLCTNSLAFHAHYLVLRTNTAILFGITHQFLGISCSLFGIMHQYCNLFGITHQFLAIPCYIPDVDPQHELQYQQHNNKALYQTYLTTFLHLCHYIGSPHLRSQKLIPYSKEVLTAPQSSVVTLRQLNSVMG